MLNLSDNQGHNENKAPFHTREIGNKLECQKMPHVGKGRKQGKLPYVVSEIKLVYLFGRQSGGI